MKPKPNTPEENIKAESARAHHLLHELQIGNDELLLHVVTWLEDGRRVDDGVAILGCSTCLYRVGQIVSFHHLAKVLQEWARTIGAADDRPHAVPFLHGLPANFVAEVAVGTGDG